MFSGIIEHVARAKNIKKANRSIFVDFPFPPRWQLVLGESIAIDGVCSTVTAIDSNTFSTYWMPETLKKTTFSAVTESKDHVYNFERPLTLSSLVGGHLVSGHVDTTGTVEAIIAEGSARIITITILPQFTRYIIYKGSITVNGVSLTVVEVGKGFFTISLIPYTLENTNLGNLIVGEKVNIEVDLIAKYLEKLSSSK